jgi:serine/threonine protein phosphatase PrpC/CRP-like cAMP-binding protein
MDLKYWAATDVGRKRTHNEDNFLVDQDLRLFIVADGMGGHASGEVASAMAVHTIREIVARERDLFEQAEDDPTWHMQVCMLLEYAVHIACETIFRKGSQEPEKKGMGTTVVCLMLLNDRGYIAYVGDSRIYLLRGGIVYQLTEDHSLMNELIRQGKITAEDFDDSPYAQFKHAMTRAVGPQELVEVDTLDFDMIPGDAFLLCSDGLYEYLEDNDISRMLSLPDIKDVPGRLIDMANTRGGKDNITALVIQVPEDASSDRAAEINFTLDTLKNIPLFRQLSYQQLVRIMNLTRIIPFSSGDTLCEQGDMANELFVILRGEIELSSNGSHITQLGGGSHFGEMALIDATPRSATATATTDGKLLVITRDDFFEILRKEAPLAVKLLWSFVQELSTRLRQTNHDLAAIREGVEEVEADELIEDAEHDDDDDADERAIPSPQPAMPSGRVLAPIALDPDMLDTGPMELGRGEDTLRESNQSVALPREPEAPVAPVVPQVARPVTAPTPAAPVAAAVPGVAPTVPATAPHAVAPPPSVAAAPAIAPPVAPPVVAAPPVIAPPLPVAGGIAAKPPAGLRPSPPRSSSSGLPAIDDDDDDDIHARATRPIEVPYGRGEREP